jgi:hypothetical protein
MSFYAQPGSPRRALAVGVVPTWLNLVGTVGADLDVRFAQVVG